MADKIIVKTPRGKITLQAGSTTAVLQWNENIQRFNGQYTRAQKWLDNEVLRCSAPFTPMRSGALMKSGILGTVIGSGVVTYVAPYARYLYYGKVMGGPPTGPKRLTDKDLVFSKSKHSQAQAFWFEAAKAQNKALWIAGARKLAGGG